MVVKKKSASVMIVGQMYEIIYTVDGTEWKMTAKFLGGSQGTNLDFSLRPRAGTTTIPRQSITSARPVAPTASIVIPKRLPKKKEVTA